MKKRSKLEFGSGLLSLVYRKSSDRTNGLGSNRVGPGFSPRQAFLGEAIMVFILMYVVLETAVNKKNKANAALAPVAIGFAVYIGHTMLIPVDGCSLNPTRSFGPALVSYIQNRGPNYFRDFWCAGGVRNCMTTGGAPRRWPDTAVDSTRPRRRRRRKSAQGLRHRPRHGRDRRGGLLQGHQRHAGQGGRERAGGARRRRQARRGLGVPLDPPRSLDGSSAPFPLGTVLMCRLTSIYSETFTKLLLSCQTATPSARHAHTSKLVPVSRHVHTTG